MNARYAAQIRAGITLARYHAAIGIACRKAGMYREWIAGMRYRVNDRRALSTHGLRAYRHTLNHGAAK